MLATDAPTAERRMIMKVCVGCVYEYDWTDPLTAIPEGCKGCKMVEGRPSNYKQKPQTNADRIRAMSDEELAKFLKEFNDCEQHIPFCQNREECWDNIPDIPEENCLTCLVAWLQKEAE